MKPFAIIIILFIALALTPLAGAQDEPLQAPRPSKADDPRLAASVAAPKVPDRAHDSFDLPPVEAMEWRAIDAEIRAIQAEAQQAIMERSRRRAELMEAWKMRYELDNMDDWELDFATGKLRHR